MPPLTHQPPTGRPRRRTPATRRPPAGTRARLRGDKGSVSTEMVAAFPLLMLLVIAGIQFGMWALGQLGAQQAANHALQTTRVAGGTTAAGRADATALLQQMAGAFLHDETITVTRTADTATVTITGHATALFGLTIPVRTTVSAPVEKFRPLQIAAPALGGGS